MNFDSRQAIHRGAQRWYLNRIPLSLERCTVLYLLLRPVKFIKWHRTILHYTFVFNYFYSFLAYWSTENHCCHHHSPPLYPSYVTSEDTFPSMSATYWATATGFELPSCRFLFISYINTSFINTPSALQTCPNHSRRFIFTKHGIFNLLYRFYRSDFFSFLVCLQVYVS